MIGIIGIVLTVVAVVVVLRLVLQRRLLVKYAALWIAVCLILMLLASVPGLLANFAELLGFEVPANLLFFLSIGLLLAVTLQLSYEVTRIERRMYRLAEELALVRADLTPGGGVTSGGPTTAGGDARADQGEAY